MNKKHYFLFIVKNISCVQFSSCHTSNEIFLASNVSQTPLISIAWIHKISLRSKAWSDENL